MTDLALTTRTKAGLAAGVLILAACGGGGGGDIARGINSLGAAFVAAFSQRPNDTPVDAQSVALTLTPNAAPFNPN